MNETILIQVGLFAARELHVPVGAAIEFAPPDRVTYTVEKVEGHETLRDTVTLKRYVLKDASPHSNRLSPYSVSLGYSEICNILVVIRPFPIS